MAGSVSAGMIEAVRTHIYDALARTVPGGTLPEEAQDALLAQACAEACGVLGDWLSSPDWERCAPSGRRPLADVVAELERVRPFIEPLGETIERMSTRQGAPAIADPATYIDEMISSTRHTARRHRRMTGEQLYEVARQRLDALKAQVCELAADYRTQAADAAKRARRRSLARKILAAIPGVLLSVSLAMAAASPGAVRQNVPQWGHDVLRLLVVHHVARTAAPTVRIAPPQAGARLG